jgi:hypothetical protein
MAMTNFPFGQEVKSFNSGEVVTPYHLPAQILDRPIGQIHHRAYLWRIGTVVASCFSLFLLLIFILLSNSSPFTVYVLGITDSGFLKQVSVLQNRYKIPPKSYENFLSTTLTGPLTGAKKEAEVWYENFVSEEAKEDIKRNFILYTITPGTLKITGFSISSEDEFKAILAYTNKKNFSRSFHISGTIIDFTPQKHDLIMANPLGFYLAKINFLPVLLKIEKHQGSIHDKKIR